MKRIIYQVVTASEQENQDGVFHYSRPFSSKDKAVREAERLKADFNGVEMVHQNLNEYGQWEKNFDIEAKWVWQNGHLI